MGGQSWAWHGLSKGAFLWFLLVVPSRELCCINCSCSWPYMHGACPRVLIASLPLLALAAVGGGGLPGMPPSMHSGLGAQHSGDANMAALHLMESLNSWQLNGGGPPAASMGQRASMDGMTGVAGAPASVGEEGNSLDHPTVPCSWASMSV